jgi:predicted nucleic acid-binding protein
MLVVADNTPLRYLILLGYVDILPALYDRVLIAQAVLQELQHPHTPALVRSWMAHVPTWLEVVQTVGIGDAALAELDAGERDAILLAQERHADVLLIDEGDGYGEATRRGIRCLRTVGLLEHAGICGLLELPEAIARLQRTNFRIHPRVLANVLARDAERKRQQSEPQA